MTNALSRRPHLGLVLGEDAAEPPMGRGVVIRAVRPASPAADAGVRPGDRMTHIDGRLLEAADQVTRLLRGLSCGSEVSITVARDAQEVSLLLRARPLPVETFAGASVRLQEVSAGGHRLRAIAVVPDDAGPHPVVYYLPGAHWASEEYPFAADHTVPALIGELARQGFASLRVERSGMGDSEGPPCTEVDFESELEGYRAGLDLLARVGWAAPGRTYLFGHSLGGIVAPLLASTPSVRGVAVFGTTFAAFSESLVGAARRRATLEGLAGDALRARLEPLAEVIRAVVRDGLTPDAVYAVRPDLAPAARQWYSGTKAFGRIARFYQQIDRLDLAQVWGDVQATVLALHGTADWVTSADDARSIALSAGAGARHVELDHVDHFMRSTDMPSTDMRSTDMPSTDGDHARGQPQRLSAQVSAVLTSWLKENDQTSTASGGQTQP